MRVEFVISRCSAPPRFKRDSRRFLLYDPPPALFVSFLRVLANDIVRFTRLCFASDFRTLPYYPRSYDPLHPPNHQRKVGEGPLLRMVTKAFVPPPPDPSFLAPLSVLVPSGRFSVPPSHLAPISPARPTRLLVNSPPASWLRLLSGVSVTADSPLFRGLRIYPRC